MARVERSERTIAVGGQASDIETSHRRCRTARRIDTLIVRRVDIAREHDAVSV